MAQRTEKEGRQPLEVHDRCGHVGLNCDICHAAAHGSSQAVLRFSFSVRSFNAPAVAVVEIGGCFVPARPAAARAKQGFVAVNDEY